MRSFNGSDVAAMCKFSVMEARTSIGRRPLQTWAMLSRVRRIAYWIMYQMAIATRMTTLKLTP